VATGQITKRLIDGLAPRESEYFVWDAALAGFGVRVQTTGAKSYVVKYRAGKGRGAPTRRVTLSRVGKITTGPAPSQGRRSVALAPSSNDGRLTSARPTSLGCGAVHTGR
jgi:hypothetical protein